MGSMNKAILMGRLTADPETRYTTDEKPVTHFSIAVERPQKNGEKAVDFFNCTAWEGLAKICGEYLKKGRLVAVEGRIQIRKYKNKEGENRILQKVGEEALEVIVASKGKDKKHLQEEMADLLFMILVLMVIKDVSLEDILEVLKKRRKSRLE